MIEQFSSGVPQVSQPAAGPYRDRQANVEQDEKSGSFEDFVKAGDRTPQQTAKKQDDDDRSADKDVDRDGPPIDKSTKVSFDLSAALRGLNNQAQAQAQTQGQAQAQLPAQVAGQMQAQVQAQVQAHVQGQLKPQNFKDILKSGEHGQLTEKQQAEMALAKLVEKAKQAVHAEKSDAADKAKADDTKPMTASDELSMLLGLTASKETDGKQGRKSSADQVDKSDKKAGADDKGADAVGKKDDARAADPMLIAIDTRHRGNDDAEREDSSSSRADVVRLVSANGRGRSVDIDVTVPGTQQQDGAKQSSAPKVETATVLEARRYLGFTPDTNGAALASAVKSDPTWTEALQSAQRTDLTTLGNTVTEVNTLKLEMNPEHLGTMVAALKLKGEELTVELRVTTVEAYHHLTADHDDIVKSLQDQGFSIDKVTVQLTAADRTDTGADRDLRQGQGQGQGQEQRDEQTAERQGQGNRNDAQREQNRWTTFGQPVDGNAGDAVADTGRPGNIYL